jgi:predicted nucleic acid-binding protein
MVIIDTDVLLLEFAFHSDPRHEDNARFLATVRERTPAITIYNLMEFLGQLSFNLAPSRLAKWRLWLQAAYGLTILWPDPGDLDAFTFLRQEIHEAPLARMQDKRMAFVDALVLNLAERGPDVEALVTWNARHFRGKTSLTVLTPAEFLRAHQG